MKKVNKIVLTAAALVALSGLAYSENPRASSAADPVDSGATSGPSMDRPVESSPAGDASRTINDLDKENIPGTGGDLEKGNYPGGSPGGMMGKYSSATKGGGKMSPDSWQEKSMP